MITTGGFTTTAWMSSWALGFSHGKSGAWRYKRRRLGAPFGGFSSHRLKSSKSLTNSNQPWAALGVPGERETHGYSLWGHAHGSHGADGYPFVAPLTATLVVILGALVLIRCQVQLVCMLYICIYI